MDSFKGGKYRKKLLLEEYIDNISREGDILSPWKVSKEWSIERKHLLEEYIDNSSGEGDVLSPWKVSKGVKYGKKTLVGRQSSPLVGRQSSPPRVWMLGQTLLRTDFFWRHSKTTRCYLSL
jgi:hypothetical protein